MKSLKIFNCKQQISSIQPSAFICFMSACLPDKPQSYLPSYEATCLAIQNNSDLSSCCGGKRELDTGFVERRAILPMDVCAVQIDTHHHLPSCLSTIYLSQKCHNKQVPEAGNTSVSLPLTTRRRIRPCT